MLHYGMQESFPFDQRLLMIREQMHADRYSQFCQRLNWELPLASDGVEVDEYDGDHTLYVCVSDGTHHLGSFRLRKIHLGTMIEDHFSSALPRSTDILRRCDADMCEITRFVCNPDLSRTTKISVLDLLTYGFETAMQMIACSRAIGVVFAPIIRLIRRSGLQFLEVERGKFIGNTLIALIFGIGGGPMPKQRPDHFIEDLQLYIFCGECVSQILL